MSSFSRLFMAIAFFLISMSVASPYESSSWLVNGNQTMSFQGIAIDYYNTRDKVYENETSFLSEGTIQTTLLPSKNGKRDTLIVSVKYSVRGNLLENEYVLFVYSVKDTVISNNEKVKIYYGYEDLWPAKFIIAEKFAYYYLENQWRILFDFYTNYVSPVGNTGFGSGFAINDNVMITNQHVIAGADSIFATNNYQNDSCNITLSVVYEDADLDIAILKADKKLVACAIDRGVYDIGEEVVAYGYPQILMQGFSLKATKGIISSRLGYKDDAKTYQIDAAVQPGNSGGPLTRNNKIIGIVSSRLEGNSQNVNYAIKSNFLGSLLDVLKIKNTGKSKPKDCTYTIMKADAEFLKSVNKEK